MIQHVLVSRLTQYPDFTPETFEKKFGVRPTPESVRAAEPVEYAPEAQRQRDYHLGRIRALMADEDGEPIEVDCFCERGRVRPLPLLLDGNHRFFAALFAERETIPCLFAGRIDLLHYLEGLTPKEPN